MTRRGCRAGHCTNECAASCTATDNQRVLCPPPRLLVAGLRFWLVPHRAWGLHELLTGLRDYPSARAADPRFDRHGSTQGSDRCCLMG